WQPAPMRRNLATAGAASGLLGTATSIGGPPMALVLSGAENATVRSNLSAFFLVGSIMSMGALAATGNLHRDIAGVFVALIPAVVLGYVASRYVNRHLDKNRLRIVSIVVSTLGAVLLIAQQLL
ncbi:TSUP family transporter, partial [Streptomyces sp. SID10244]|nr:TSUP family transporter [Streptomyces sp. SID10244]